MTTNGDANIITDALQAREFYQSRGIDSVIPLPANEKSPAWLGKQWQTRPVDELWRERGRRDCNIGVRFPVSNGLCAIDADDKKVAGTSANIANKLAGLGLAAVTYTTPSGGGRFVFVCHDAPALEHGRPNIAPEFGAGEVYVSAGQVVLPWSSIDGRRYLPASGDWSALPDIAWHDLAQFITTATPIIRTPRTRGAGQVAPLAELPVVLLHRGVPSDVDELLAQLKNATPKQSTTAGGKTYTTRSDAEQAIITKLILCGWTFDDVAALFHRAQPAGWASDSNPFAYLRRSWNAAMRHLTSTPIRQTLADCYARTLAQTWAGRTGRTDKAVMLAIVAQCWAAGAPATSVSVREVAEQTTSGNATVSRSLWRLQKAGEVERMTPTLTANDAPLSANILKISQSRMHNNGTRVIYSSSLSATAEQAAAGGRGSNMTLVPFLCIGDAELWARARLGQSAREVYSRLSDAPMTGAQLAAAAGCHRNTVSDALKKLAGVGLARQVSRRQWVRGERSLASVADELDCKIYARRRRQRHDEEREFFKRKRAKAKAARQAVR